MPSYQPALHTKNRNLLKQKPALCVKWADFVSKSPICLCERNNACTISIFRHYSVDTHTLYGCSMARQSSGPGSGLHGGRPDWRNTRLPGGCWLSAAVRVTSLFCLAHFFVSLSLSLWAEECKKRSNRAACPPRLLSNHLS